MNTSEKKSTAPAVPAPSEPAIVKSVHWRDIGKAIADLAAIKAALVELVEKWNSRDNDSARDPQECADELRSVIDKMP